MLQGDPLSPIISVLYMSAMLHQLFPYNEDSDTRCLSYIDNFVLLTASPSLERNIDILKNEFIKLSQAFNALGVTIETSETELTHFAAKQQTGSCGRKPIRFNVLHSMLPNIELHPTRRNTPTYIIAPSKEWHYLGFYFDPFLSFSSHCRKHVYQAVVWSVLSYGLLLWYRLNGKGCKAQVKLLTKTQNVVLRWITGAFRTTPIAWMEYLAGIPPVQQKANYMLRNALQRSSRLPSSHILNHMALALPVHHHDKRRAVRRSPQENIWLLKEAAEKLPPIKLLHPITRVGNRLLDCTTCVRITIPAAPPRASKVFDQWAEGWMRSCHADAVGQIIVGSDGSYKVKGQGVSAFVVQEHVYSQSRIVVTHSSYDAEMHAANQAIEYLADHHDG